MDAAVNKFPQSVTNESKVRLTAFFVLALAVCYFFTNSIFIPVFFVFDFGLRSFDLGKYSPLAFISDRLVKTCKLPVKPVYFPPKRFAARIGLGFSVMIVLLQIINVSTIFLAGVLAIFAALESLAGICAGCYVFDWLQKFKKAT